LLLSLATAGSSLVEIELPRGMHLGRRLRRTDQSIAQIARERQRAYGLRSSSRIGARAGKALTRQRKRERLLTFPIDGLPEKTEATVLHRRAALTRRVARRVLALVTGARSRPKRGSRSMRESGKGVTRWTKRGSPHRHPGGGRRRARRFGVCSSPGSSSRGSTSEAAG